MKYLGVDWGLKKIGLALSEGNLASPFGSLKIQSLQEGIEKIKKIIKDHGIEMVVIGKPGGESGKWVEKAIKLLEDLKVSVIRADETLSTYKAKNLMIEMGVGQKKRRDEDTIAAVIILQRYLDEKH
jgi:putative transcription antitermination factor YqgF